MSAKIFLLGFSFILLVSCQKTTILYFKTNEAKGLEIGDFIMIDEQTIGEVTGFGLTETGDVIISSELSTEMPIPTNSKFKNSSYAKEGQRCIKVTLGNSETNVTNQDTLQLKYSYDKIINEGKEKIIDKVKGIFKKKDK